MLIERHFAVVRKEHAFEQELESASKSLAYLAGLSTPEPFAAPPWVILAEMGDAGVLDHPYSQDSREQAMIVLTETLRSGHIADNQYTLVRVGV